MARCLDDDTGSAESFAGLYQFDVLEFIWKENCQPVPGDKTMSAQRRGDERNTIVKLTKG